MVGGGGELFALENKKLSQTNKRIAPCNPLSGVAKDEGQTWEGKNHSHLARPDLRRFERPAPSAVYSSRSGLARRRGAAAARVCMAKALSKGYNI